MKTIKYLFATLLLLCTTVATAHDFEAGGIYYNILSSTEKTVEITSGTNEYTGSVVIPESVTYNGTTYSVTSIGWSAFRYCPGLTSITIPNSVTSIEYAAFYDCYNLTRITIPNSVKSIGNIAFSGCTGLTSITIPSSVTSIGYGAFGGTAWYNNQPDGVVYAGKVLYSYKGTMPANTSITIKDGTLGIADAAFAECTGLTSVVIPNSVTSIGYAAFYGCSGLKSITIPNSVTSIGDDALFEDYVDLNNGYGVFEGCSGLTSITIGNSVTSIEYEAFRDCTGLIAVHISDIAAWCCIDFGSTDANPLYYANNLYLNGEKITSLVIPEGVTNIKFASFNGCTGLTSITIPNSVISIGYYAFEGTAWYNNQPDGVVYAGKVLYEYKGTMPANTSITIKDGTLGIADAAFSGCTGLTSITIPNSVTRIGGSAFSGCTGLTSITIPNSVTSIGSYAFSDCTGLTSITIPNSVTSIEHNAFIGCTGLTSIVIGNGVTSIGNSAFGGCSGITSIVIGNGVTSIGGDAFSGCSGLTSVVIPSSVTSIGSYAFSGCSGLTSVVIGNGVTSIEGEAFFGCSGLTSITVETGNTNYDSRDNCNAIIETATNTLITGCQNSVIPNSVTSIGDGAFYGCTGLTSITIPNSVTSIGERAFLDCTGLTSITIPNSVTSIGYYAFADCSGLKTVYNFSNLTFSKGSTNNGDVAYYADKVYNVPNGSVEGDFIFGKPNNVNTLLYYLGNATELTLTADYKGENYVIGANSFASNTTITSVTIPNSVTSIGDAAFANCINLKSITIHDGVKTIGESAFSGCSKVETIYIGNSIESIKNYAFANCNNIFEIEIASKKAITASGNVFSNDAYNNVCLYVPKGRKFAYERTTPWKNFYIVEKDFTGNNKMNGKK